MSSIDPELPLFPLNTVLFPDGVLPLRIFEARYVDMVGRCMREASPFGVIPIRSGPEAGGGIVEAAEVGTTVRIVDFSKLPDGLLGITCKGERKFRVRKLWQRPDGLNVGDIEYLPAEVTADLPEEYVHLSDLLRKVLPELGEPYTSMPGNFADALWVGSRLTEILPVSSGDKAILLELDEPLVRLARLNQIVRRVVN
jgi:Lon protease-like protein